MLQFVQDYLALIIVCMTFLYLLYVSSSLDKTHTQTRDLQRDMPSPFQVSSDQENFLSLFEKSSKNTATTWGIRRLYLVLYKGGTLKECCSGTLSQLAKHASLFHTNGESTIVLQGKFFEERPIGDSCSVSWVPRRDGTLKTYPTTTMRYFNSDIRHRVDEFLHGSHFKVVVCSPQLMDY